MMDEAFIPSEILEPLIRPACALEEGFVLLHFCRKGEFDLLLSMTSSVQSSRWLLFRSVIKCSLNHAPSSFTHQLYLNVAVCMKLHQVGFGVALVNTNS